MAGRKPLTESQQLIAGRRVARRLAMQGVYQWLITGNSFRDIYLYFQEETELAADFRKSDSAFFHKLLKASIEGGEELENCIAPLLSTHLPSALHIFCKSQRYACGIRETLRKTLMISPLLPTARRAHVLPVLLRLHTHKPYGYAAIRPEQRGVRLQRWQGRLERLFSKQEY